MQDDETSAPAAPKRPPWNKGKLIGAKPPPTAAAASSPAPPTTATWVPPLSSVADVSVPNANSVTFIAATSMAAGAVSPAERHGVNAFSPSQFVQRLQFETSPIVAQFPRPSCRTVLCEPLITARLSWPSWSSLFVLGPFAFRDGRHPKSQPKARDVLTSNLSGS